MENVNLEKNECCEPYQLDIAKFTIKSLFLVIVAGVLLVASFLNFFHYPAMKFYTSLNIKPRALESAEFYLNSSHEGKNDVLPMYNSKYADALLCAVNNSISLMNSNSAKEYDSKTAKKYAQKVDKYSRIYLSYNVKGSMGDRSELIDAYNLRHTAPQNHPSLVSFNDFIAVKQAKARFILGEDTLVLNECQKIMQNWSEQDWQIENTADKNDINAKFLCFDKLNQYLARELLQINFYDLPKSSNGEVSFDAIKDNIILKGNNFALFINSKGEFTDLYNKINLRFDDFKAYIKQNAKCTTAKKQLQTAYYLKIMTEFVQNMQYFSLVVGANYEKYDTLRQETLQNLYSSVWKPHSIVLGAQIYEGGSPIIKDVTMNEWYTRGVLIDYLALYAQGEQNG